ncbi:hypothetical protein LCGC14_0273840 [marine sediment metagenome]|uniref:Uncharacterized protein n=1 Tax=marine sediment metagenome TaxID=412755 RepID=A0A0F9UF22_9ZZZZ
MSLPTCERCKERPATAVTQHTAELLCEPCIRATWNACAGCGHRASYIKPGDDCASCARETRESKTEDPDYNRGL